jgi:hypothetical protein
MNSISVVIKCLVKLVLLFLTGGEERTKQSSQLVVIPIAANSVKQLLYADVMVQTNGKTFQAQVGKEISERRDTAVTTPFTHLALSFYGHAA